MDWNTVGIETNFGSLDWCIVVGYLIIIVAVGVYIKRYIIINPVYLKVLPVLQNQFHMVIMKVFNLIMVRNIVYPLATF